MFKRNYVKVKRETWKCLERAFLKALSNESELRAYRGTEFTPDEVHLMSERLAAFEETGLEPADVKVLAERDTAKEAVIKGEGRIMFCPVCGHFYASTADYARENPFCERCGQRIVVPVTTGDS